MNSLFVNLYAPLLLDSVKYKRKDLCQGCVYDRLTEPEEKAEHICWMKDEDFFEASIELILDFTDDYKEWQMMPKTKCDAKDFLEANKDRLKEKIRELSRY